MLQKQDGEARGPRGPPGWGLHREGRGGGGKMRELFTFFSLSLYPGCLLGNGSRVEEDRGRPCLDVSEAVGQFCV